MSKLEEAIERYKRNNSVTNRAGVVIAQFLEIKKGLALAQGDGESIDDIDEVAAQLTVAAMSYRPK
ncbi:MAG: hypothetical protein WBG17_14960 [Burkholderiaceae bacterium]